MVVSWKILLVNDNWRHAPAENVIYLNPTPVRENVSDVKFGANVTNVSTGTKTIDNVLCFLFFLQFFSENM